MKVTFSKDGSIEFEVESASDAVELARALQNGSVTASPPVADTEAADEPCSNNVLASPKVLATARAKYRNDVSLEEQRNRLSAQEMGLSYRHFLVWDFLVAQEHRKGGVSPEMVVRHFKITRSAATQRLARLVEAGYAIRLVRGRYKAAISDESPEVTGS